MLGLTLFLLVALTGKNLAIMVNNPPPAGATTNWLAGIDNNNNNNDVIQQVDIQPGLLATNSATAALLMQSINNLMPPGQKARILLYRTY